jgi:AAA domain
MSSRFKQGQHYEQKVHDEPGNTGRSAPRGWKFHSGVRPEHARWAIKQIIPEVGIGLMSGQWGTYKTTAALDISVSVMALPRFADTYKVKRRGAVLYFAPEGGPTIDSKITAIARHRGVTGPLPFVYRDDCPKLVDLTSADAICRMADEAAAEIKRQFDLPVVLVWIDTVITAAGFKPGEENDSAAGLLVMNTLRRISEHLGAMVIGIDHFGKSVETGTRGTSAKEDAADLVLALLGDKELGGGVKNSRLAMRKMRQGAAGFELPFVPRIEKIDTDEDGDPITAAVIDWQDTRQSTQTSDTGWTKSILLLRRVLTTTLATHGKNLKPFPDGPMVCACDVEAVRAEFYLQRVADTTKSQNADAKLKAFNRSIDTAQGKGLIVLREIDGIQLIWLAKPDDGQG